jgi:hypothetical protein
MNMESARKMADKKERKARRDQARLNEFLGRGGQAQMRRTGEATIFQGRDAKGARLRVNATGHGVQVGQILDPRLKLTREARAVGNCYGAFYERAQSSGAPEFLREYVDGGGGSSGGYSEHQAHCINMVNVAREALKATKMVRYKRPESRGVTKTKVGRHRPIKQLELIDAVCVNGHTIKAIAIRFQWFVTNYDAEGSAIVRVPDRQVKAIVEGLSAALIVVADAWKASNMKVPSEFMEIETR